ncbi:selenium metabolism-associated LysR family transcriptional regulator [Neobacillus vireti]|uniref:Transcriptional regulator, LysR family protein n=1 Tax=Neobacillus vireti LMG 21834 TaxID=1131730 RepID=A0AB94IL76_9BACI|nr:selenium metabolism-associated LysR family transcriptional regulator [Neobacillus vireti]ETI67789.1 transcriptional regulator, LysR family protein [Neobacillus vireti LMG 21834]KLT18570.1 LysR family transcriptional regulator [Neobacillus vireti]
MDLHQLFVFTKVVEHKSFSKAAEDIFLSQSTVSSHIHGLEKTLGLKLFDRVGRESILTPQGERLYQWALKLLLIKDQAILDLTEGMAELRGIIRIAASSVPGQFMLPKMVKQFREQYPEALFRINQSSSKIVAEKVLHGSVDIGILGEKYVDDKLLYLPLLKEKLVLITSNQVDLSEGNVNIEDILQYPFVMRNSDSGTNAILEKFLKKNNIAKDKLNVISYIEDGQSLIQFVMQDVGISIVSEIAAREYAAKDMLRMYDINSFNDERFFYLVYNINKTQSLLSKLFIDSARDLF